MSDRMTLLEATSKLRNDLWQALGEWASVTQRDALAVGERAERLIDALINTAAAHGLDHPAEPVGETVTQDELKAMKTVVLDMAEQRFYGPGHISMEWRRAYDVLRGIPTVAARVET